jgi:uncharacterized protein YbjT (DUF2867 family)
LKVLVLGATLFWGRHSVEAALARDRQATLLHRGQHNADIYPLAAWHER